MAGAWVRALAVIGAGEGGEERGSRYEGHGQYLRSKQHWHRRPRGERGVRHRGAEGEERGGRVAQGPATEGGEREGRERGGGEGRQRGEACGGEGRAVRGEGPAQLTPEWLIFRLGGSLQDRAAR